MLNGPIQIALFCLLIRYRTLCFWLLVPCTKLCFAYWSSTERFVLFNAPVPKFETASSQAGNHRLPLQGTPGSQTLPLQGTAGSQRLELLVPNLGTIGYHCKELPVPRDWNSWLPTLEPLVTLARNFRVPEIATPSSQPWNHRLPLQRTDGSQRLELLVSQP